MKAFIAAVVVFFISSFVLSTVFSQLLGLGFIGTVLALFPAWLVYRRIAAPAVVGGDIASAADGAGAATFSWKGVDVYQDKGYFTYRGRRYQIANVVKVSYETSGARGCMGGTHYKVHIHMRDLEMPRVTVGAGNITNGGNDETERNYERLAIVLGQR